ncbi:mandelate racemase/muconate lactonizing enzyme family protein [Tunicatimonas pelagia]|uniref:mandelate racemase/muconate lactonizing enzyme family protein n=1 Tax=Tunicatimonas pelagia TaxID=931531 RepID=UPI0026667670|nr:mandelate racemase/muconate lactonizing enzyme family protein [Tunicatimonas pelagia]WKN44865.1 mandelate racemase/muconate lactonizing enzyme family protein [Tunicatimonas pelagia]
MKNIEPSATVTLPTLETPIHREQFDIQLVEMRCVAPIEFARPFYDATMGPFTSYRACFVRLTDRSGAWGECEFPATATDLLRHVFVSLLLETPKNTYEELYRKLYWGIRNEGFRGGAALALGHLDRIFHDLAARRKGVPLFRYLGGRSPRVRAYASGGGIHLTGSELVDECLAWEAQGYTTIKIKFGSLTTTVKEDLVRITSVREALRSETQLAIDANQSMSLPKAQKLSQALGSLDIAWLEEPIHSAALHEIEALCAHSPIPISYGESERSALVFPSLVRAGVKHMQPIAGHISSLHEWLSVANLARRHELTFSGGGTSHINASALAVVGGEALLEYLEPVVGVMASLLRVGPTVQDGYFTVPEVPGIGAEVDWERLEKKKQIVDRAVWKNDDQ